MNMPGGTMTRRGTTFLKRQAPKLNLQRLENVVANRVWVVLAQATQKMKALSSALMLLLPAATSRALALPTPRALALPLGHQDLPAVANTVACARTGTTRTTFTARDSSQQ